MALTRIRNTAITLDAAEIPNLSADKITSGSFADGRISQSSVVQHSPETDLQPVKSDITALALREATNESAAAFSLPNQHIDTFATDTLGTKTNVLVSSGALTTVETAVDIYGGTDANTYLFLSSFNKVNGNTVFTDQSSNAHAATNSGGVIWSDTQSLSGTTCSIYGDGSGDGITFSHADFQNLETISNYTVEYWSRKLGGHDYNSDSILDIGQIQQWEYGTDPHKLTVYNTSFGGNVSESSEASEDAWHHYAYTKQGGSTMRLYVDGTQVSTHSNSGNNAYTDNYVRLFQHRSDAPRWFKGWIDGFRISNNNRYPDGTSFTPAQFTGGSVSATGTAIQAANAVGSAKTKVGGTLLYKDVSGTNTLGTDIKVYFTCDGGSNWTEATSYNAITPVYSTGVKQVRLGETTCTSGTDVRYKAVWANQASGSKETQLHGIGINY